MSRSSLYYPSKRKSAGPVRLTLGILVGLAIFALGIYFDITWFLVGGIEEAIHGFQANPVNSAEAAWGIVRALFAGVGAFFGIIIGLFVRALIAGDQSRWVRSRWTFSMLLSVRLCTGSSLASSPWTYGSPR